MPNWCSNKLTILGKASRLAEFAERARGLRPAYKRQLEKVDKKVNDEINVLEFHNFVPVPKEVLDAGYDPAGYNWEIANWSVKWGACCAQIEDSKDENELCYVFDTPWRDPNLWFARTAALYPDLTFYLEFSEPSMGFSGSSKYSGGKETKRTYTEEYTSEDVSDEGKE